MNFCNKILPFTTKVLCLFPEKVKLINSRRKVEKSYVVHTSVWDNYGLILHKIHNLLSQLFEIFTEHGSSHRSEYLFEKHSNFLNIKCKRQIIISNFLMSITCLPLLNFSNTKKKKSFVRNVICFTFSIFLNKNTLFYHFRIVLDLFIF